MEQKRACGRMQQCGKCRQTGDPEYCVTAAEQPIRDSEGTSATLPQPK